jgi:hypothetical protein
VLVLPLLFAGSAVSAAGAAPSSPDTFFDRSTIERFAPVVVFHSGEKLHPVSGREFLDHAGLAFSHDDCKPDYHHYRIENGRPNPWTDQEIEMLGDGGFVAQLRSSRQTGCEQLSGSENAFSTRDRTRPYEKGRSGKLKGREGWYLDLANDARVGFPDEVAGNDRYETRAPTYFDDGLLYEGNKPTGYAFITYWFLYAYNDGPSRINHEGDWENVSLRLHRDPRGRWRPVDVFYAKHGNESDVVDWEKAYKVSWDGNSRLGVLSAKGTHGSYGGRVHPLRFGDRIDKNGPSWATWTRLRYLWDQGWVGYCGAWGSIGRLTTGPLGPGCIGELGRPAKSGRPKAWGYSVAGATDGGG